jgi:DNA polymerase (family 10)
MAHQTPSNAEIAALLADMSAMMDILGEDSFRSAAHARASRTIGDLADAAGSLTRDQLLKLDGVGAKMADKIIELAKTGRVAEYDELAARLPKGLLELTTIPGVGPKTVRVMWQQGGITDLASLKAAIADGSILKLPRMGEKAVAKIRDNIALIADANMRTWLGKADAIARTFVELLSALPRVTRVVPAGSLRRGKETVGDIDILVAVECPADQLAAAQKHVAETFRAAPGVHSVIIAGDNKSSVRVALENSMGRWKPDPDAPQSTIQVDLRVLPAQVFGAALSYFTGSKEHNVRLRERALKMGMTLNEWGLFPNDSEPTPPQSRGIAPVAAATEESIYAALKLPYIPPELREDRGELDLAATPRLVELADIKAELHSHTTASDGTMSIEELARRAKARGFHTIAVTDHSRSSAIANGLSIERLLEHIRAVHAARKNVEGITILAGSEVDILADGELDYPDEILAQLDVVVASPHTALSQDPAAATARLLRAIEHPRVNILGHPTGRLINKRAGLSPDMSALIVAAKKNNVALEINAHWLRLDLRDAHVRAAVEAGCLIAIDCDVHEPDDFDNLKYGVATGRRGWLTPELCVNTWSQPALASWLAKSGRR